MDLFFVVGFWLLLYLKWHIHGYSFFFKNHKSYECFTGFNVNVWGQDFFPLSPFRNRAFCFKSPQKVSITLHAILKIFEQVDHERHFQAGEKSCWVPLDCKVFPDLEACIKLAWITSVPGNRNYWLLLSVLTAVHTRQPAATLTAPAAFHKNM